MEELTDNAEEPDEAESKQSEVKLGKLQYKVISISSSILAIFIIDREIWKNLSINNKFFSILFLINNEKEK